MKAPVATKELIPEDNYVATLYRIIYIGTVDEEYKGESKTSFKVDLTWELNHDMKVWKEGEEPKPTVVSRQYTLSMGSKSNLRPIVEGMVGGMSDAEAVNFDLDELLGKACLLNVTHGVSETGREKMNLSTTKLLKGMEAPKPFNPQKILSYEHWDEEFYQSLPDWLKLKIASTPEFKNKDGYKVPTVKIDDGSAPNVDSIPF